MEIKIGIQNIAREVSIETDRTGEQVEADLREAMTSHGLFSLTDTKGRKVIVPASAIGYVDLGQEHQRAVGFGQI